MKEGQESGQEAIVTTFWSDGVARSAVPLVFLVSGYLYFADFDGSQVSYLAKTHRRVHTLLLPYLLWNGLVIAGFAIGRSWSITQAYFNGATIRRTNVQ